jgi:hemerythrin-like domain-containing protein
MLPIGPLMIEHRLIERLIYVMQKHADRIKKGRITDVDFIDNCIDFIKTYADRCHHGKEEEILFKELGKFTLSDKHARTLKELIDEHNYGRNLTTRLVEVRNKYFNASTEAEKQIHAFKIYEYLKEFIDLYPKHIKKEDKDFFLPVMDYFSDIQKQEMLAQFYEFDRKLIHKKYKKLVETYE